MGNGAKKTYAETVAIIDSVLTLLRDYPDARDGIDFNLNVSGSPLELIMTILKHTKGYDKVFNFVSNAAWALCEPLELTVKTIMLDKLRDMLTCTVADMRINGDLINEGFVVSIDDIDLMKMLRYSPLPGDNLSGMGFFGKSFGTKTNVGKYYYFGCDRYEKADDVIDANDFNALLWYMRTRSTERVIWYKADPYNEYREGKTPQQALHTTQATKDDGIVTLEYHEDGKSLTMADGTPYYLQTPMSRCLHVFIGNTKFDKDSLLDVKQYEEEVASDHTTQLGRLADDCRDMIEKCKKEKIKKNNIDSVDNTNKINNDSYICNRILDDIEKKENITVAELLGRYGEVHNSGGQLFIKGQYFKNKLVGTPTRMGNVVLSSVESAFKDRMMEYGFMSKNLNGSNPLIEANYYYGKPIMLFNFDYIWSMRLFDRKVVAAQIIDALSGCLNLDFDIYAAIVMEEVSKIVDRVVNADNEYEVDDCFFRFTNEGYNALLEKAEGYKMGYYTIAGSTFPVKGVSPEELLSGLDGLSEATIDDNGSHIIKEALINVSKKIGVPNTDSMGANIGGDFSRMNGLFIENMLNALANAIVRSVISPKLYLMYAINFQVMKQSPNFNILDFIDNFKDMIVSIVRAVTDAIMKMLMDMLKDILKDLMKGVSELLVKEQMDFYKQLIMDCVQCLSLINSSTVGWSMGDVDYADIIGNDENRGESPYSLETKELSQDKITC